MKKLVLFAVVACAISLASCGGNTTKTEGQNVDSAAVEVQQVDAVITDTATNTVDSASVTTVKEEVKK